MKVRLLVALAFLFVVAGIGAAATPTQNATAPAPATAVAPPAAVAPATVPAADAFLALSEISTEATSCTPCSDVLGCNDVNVGACCDAAQPIPKCGCRQIHHNTFRCCQGRCIL